MESPLWIDRHRPRVEELPQAEVRRYLGRISQGPVNLLIHGPPGVGKTAAVHALARELHDDPETGLLTINVADFFGMTKRELVSDPRFAGFIDAARKRDSKAKLVNHLLKEMAGYPPVGGSFKTILLDNSEAMREDFQQALRRVMEQFYEATQFIIVTRRTGAVIEPIRSRCAQVPIRAPTQSETVSVLEEIADREGVPSDRDGLEFVAGYAKGDLRRAILAAQTTAVDAGEITMDAAYEALDQVGHDDQFVELLEEAERGSFGDARGILDDLLIDEGYDGGELLGELLRVARTRYEPDDIVELYTLAGDVGFDLTRGANDRVHLSHLIARLHPGVAEV